MFSCEMYIMKTIIHGAFLISGTVEGGIGIWYANFLRNTYGGGRVDLRDKNTHCSTLNTTLRCHTHMIWYSENLWPLTLQTVQHKIRMVMAFGGDNITICVLFMTTFEYLLLKAFYITHQLAHSNNRYYHLLLIPRKVLEIF